MIITKELAKVAIHAFEKHSCNAESVIKGQYPDLTHEDFLQLRSNYDFNKLADYHAEKKVIRRTSKEIKRLFECGIHVDKENLSIAIPSNYSLTEENEKDIKKLESLGFKCQVATFDLF